MINGQIPIKPIGILGFPPVLVYALDATLGRLGDSLGIANNNLVVRRRFLT